MYRFVLLSGGFILNLIRVYLYLTLTPMNERMGE